MSEIEKTCENCEYELEDMEGMHCRHCIHSAEEHFKLKEIRDTEQEIRNKVIDEFVEILVRNKSYVVDECYGYTIPLSEFYKIEEHMKKGE